MFEAVKNSTDYSIDFENIQVIKEIRLTFEGWLTLCEVQVFASKYGSHFML